MVSFLLGYVGLVRLLLHLGLCGWLLDLVDRFGFFVVGVMVWRFLIFLWWCCGVLSGASYACDSAFIVCCL